MHPHILVIYMYVLYRWHSFNAIYQQEFVHSRRLLNYSMFLIFELIRKLWNKAFVMYKSSDTQHSVSRQMLAQKANKLRRARTLDKTHSNLKCMILQNSSRWCNIDVTFFFLWHHFILHFHRILYQILTVLATLAVYFRFWTSFAFFFALLFCLVAVAAHHICMCLCTFIHVSVLAAIG